MCLIRERQMYSCVQMKLAIYSICINIVYTHTSLSKGGIHERAVLYYVVQVYLMNRPVTVSR